MARAIAEAMAPPMLEFAICCISMISGKTRDSPASASALMRPTKCASTVAVTAMSTTLTTTFGAARRSSVETIGPSRRRRVRAAGGFAVAIVGEIAAEIAGVGWAIEALPFVMALLPLCGTGAALGRERLEDTGRLREGPMLSEICVWGA